MQRLFVSCKMLLLSIVITLLAACASGPRTFNISAEELQNRASTELSIPITVLQIFDIYLSNPVITLDAGTERLLAQLDTSIGNPLSDKPLHGKINISGTLYYDAASRAITLANSRIESLDISDSGLEENYRQLFNQLAVKLGEGLLDNMVLYTLTPEELKIGVPRDFRIIGNNLQVTLLPQ